MFREGFVKRISFEQNDDLERKVSNEEIKMAIWDCGIDKAPGPDSFTFGFYRRYWDIISNDVVDAVKWFFCMEGSRNEVDFEKAYDSAYDSVRWDFIDDILRRINMNKSNLMGIFMDSNKVKHAAVKIGCLVLKTPLNYLGSRAGDFMSRIQSCHDVTKGMHTRLSKWKLKTLSIGGRLTLLKAVLGATPIYHMSIFKVHIKVLQNMESIRARFLMVRMSILRNRVGLDGNVSWLLKMLAVLGVVKALHGEDGKIGKKVQHRKLIENAILSKGISKTRWIKEVPIKIFVHAWKVRHD
nr:RNA-directed DNA polymerase, eukaryota [Tanacetum cinerariifolium]